MGNSISSSNLVPNTLLECFDRNGKFDVKLYYLYRRRERQVDDIDFLLANAFDAAYEEIVASDKSQPQQRSVKRRKLEYIDPITNEIRELTPQVSNWYVQYISSPNLSSRKWRKRFRRVSSIIVAAKHLLTNLTNYCILGQRFRVPYEDFLDLLQQMKEDPVFNRWLRKDAVGKPATPIELLLLGSLRYLGRGWTFDCLQEATAVSEETHRVFFHVFIRWGNSTLFEKHVSSSFQAHQMTQQLDDMKAAGFPGCIGSTDATNIGLEKCPYRVAQMHKGHKLSLPARTYNLTCTHRREIMYTTRGHPSRWNDKTLQRFDTFGLRLRDGTAFSDHVFELYEYASNGNVVAVKYRGAWLLSDNGYLRWSTTIPPFKDPHTRAQTRFSEWLESMRKDVECTFGILKGRFRILKTGIRLHSLESVDAIWGTCCALHNYLLQKDGLLDGWETSADNQSEWTGNIGCFDEAADVLEHLPEQIQRLFDEIGMEPRDFDVSGIGAGDDRSGDDGTDNDDSDARSYDDPEGTGGGERLVHRLSQDYFREKLVEHFDIMFKQGRIVWPARVAQPAS